MDVSLDRYRRTPPWLFIAATLACALFLRVAAAGGELWLDEIWSLELAGQVESPVDLITKLKHDNNHLLNTAWLAAMGDDQPWMVYRLPSILAGSLAAVLAGVIASRWGTVQSLTAMTMMATSYVMVHYASEARGYALLMLFVLAASDSLLRIFERGGWEWIACFWGCCAAGFASHPLFLQFWFASVFWTIFACRHRRKWFADSADRPASSGPKRVVFAEWKPAVLSSVAHAMPFVMSATLYGMNWRDVELGGGPGYNLSSKLATAASLVVGGPTQGGWSLVAALAGIVTVSAGLRIAREAPSTRTTASREEHASAAGETGPGTGPDRPPPSPSNIGAGYLLSFVVAFPLLQAIVMRPPFLFVRYFLIAILIGVLALSLLLGWVYGRGSFGRRVYALSLVCFLSVNTYHTAQLVWLGRGHYRAALAFISSNTTDPTVTISSDHNFGVSKLIEFYGARMRPPREFVYIKGQEWPTQGPEWLVLHREAGQSAEPVEPVLRIDGHEFQLLRFFECAPLSGWQWACYHRVSTGRRAASEL